ncbi:MAG: (d)CMP kinase [Kordiimonadaceae bacterium]|nr:(d)CMP kinase [Kordiimonadaceae bacterium]
MLLSKKLIIALDGPAASGKGTLGRRLAAHYNLALLDTGALYRAVGWNVIQKGGNPSNVIDALEALKDLSNIDFSNKELRSESIGTAASQVAALPTIRHALVDFQRTFANNPPPNKNGTILDGRDIGTVICPDTPFKIFITADVEIRAKRRFLEEFGNDENAKEYKKILNKLRDRDKRDTSRASSPLKQAKNAHLIDTSYSDIEAVFDAAIKFVSSKM